MSTEASHDAISTYLDELVMARGILTETDSRAQERLTQGRIYIRPTEWDRIFAQTTSAAEAEPTTEWRTFFDEGFNQTSS